MPRLKRPRNNPGKEVPDNLLFTALRWETMRQQYFTSIGRLDDAMEAHYLRTIYSKRLWDEHGISVDLK
jgi:hypothetical protein